MSESRSPRYAIISADTHAGAALLDYKPYLPKHLHDDFDAWASEFQDGWRGFDVAEAVASEVHDKDIHMGVSSAGSPYNWDSPLRLGHLEGQGIAAEVVLPNTVPPFFPSGIITAAAPASAEEYKYRWAGIKAHNRWLVDFCSLAPGRRGGIAQVFLYDLDDAVREVVWAREHGLMGVILPGDHHRKLVNLFELSLDRFWAACADLSMPVHRHSQAVSDPETPESGPAAIAVGIKEGYLFGSRALPHLMIGGVFHRHPTLKFVFTEFTAEWAVGMLENLDHFFKEGTTKGTKMYAFAHRACEYQDMLPSEYARRNLFFAGVMTRSDFEATERLGKKNIMWGSDYPHHEGTFPNTTLALRNTMGDLPEQEIRALLAGNAASVYGFDLDLIQGVADKIGPTVEEVGTPLRLGEIPEGNVCFAFSGSPGAFH